MWNTSSAAADASDARAKAGISLGPLDGTIVSIKDLFDIVGEVTRSCSKILDEEGKLAEDDAPIVQRFAQSRRGYHRQDQHDGFRLFGRRLLRIAAAVERTLAG